MDFPGRLIAAFLAVLLITFFPLQYIANTAERNIDSYIDNCTEQLSDTIRTKGYLDTHTYETFVRKLDSLGEVYDIEIEDIHPVTGEDVTLFDGDDHQLEASTHEAEQHICDDQGCMLENDKLAFMSFKNETEQHICNDSNCFFNNDILDYMSSNKKYISDGREQLSTKNNEINSLAAHTHTDDCYAGHRHTSSCIANDLSGQVYAVCNDTYDYYSQYGNFQKINMQFYCAKCGRGIADLNMTWYRYVVVRYEMNIYLPDPSGQLVNVASFSNYGHSGPTNYPSFEQDIISTIYGLHKAFFGYEPLNPYCWGKSKNIYFKDMPGFFYYDSDFKKHIYPQQACWNCGSYDVNYCCGQTQDETPVCNQVVTSITPTNPNQTVKKGESLITTATATYLDGHTGIVNCTSNINTNVGGLQTVTLTYSGLVGNAKTTGTRTCTISVMVITKTLTSISVTPTAQVIWRKMLPYFTVSANYSDGTSTILGADKYSVSAFNPEVVGHQRLTITYTEDSVTRTATFDEYVDDLLSITVTPSILTVDRYTKQTALPITVTANAMYNPSWNITGACSISGYSPNNIGLQTVTVSYKHYETTRTAQIQVNVTALHKTCPRCGNTYELNVDDTDPGCPFCKNLITGITVSPEEVETTLGGSLPITVQAEYNDGTKSTIYGWTSNFDPYKSGLQIVTVNYGGYAASVTVWVRETEITCPICQTKYPASEGMCPVCREKITGIHVTPEEITVNQYENIVLEVIATYADEVSAPVTGWSIDKTSSVAGVFTATVSYEGFTAQVKLTVMSASSVTCPICGLVYDVGEYPNGCPVCSEVITGIEAFLSTGSRLVQYGSVPAISVVLVFLDNHKEIIETGYTTEGYNPFQMGEQTILVRYEKFSCTLDVKVVNTLETVRCPNGHVYYLNEDGSDPGCPFCVIGDRIGVVVFYDITYLPDILEELYTAGTYYFNQNNFLTVRVTKRDQSLIAKLQETSLKLVTLGRKRRFTYGGEVS